MRNEIPQKMTPSINTHKRISQVKELPKELQLAMLHVLNGQIYRMGVIPQDIYEKAEAGIDRL